MNEPLIPEVKRGGFKRRDRQREDLTQGELAELLKAARDKGNRHPERDYCLLLLIARHGFRVTEALNLRVSDIDWDGMQLNFKRLKQKNKSRSDRHPIYDLEAKALRNWLVKREKMNLGHTNLGTDHLFISEQRRPMSRSMVHRMVQKYAKAAGLESLNVHCHMMRHGCAYDLANRGADILLIKNFMGHQNVQNTLIYTQRAGRQFEILYNDRRTLRRG